MMRSHWQYPGHVEPVASIPRNLPLPWVAAPGSELIIPALAGDGLALVCVAGSTQFTEVVTIFFAE